MPGFLNIPPDIANYALAIVLFGLGLGAVLGGLIGMFLDRRQM